MSKTVHSALPAKMAPAATVGHSRPQWAKNGVAPRTSSAVKARIVAAHMAGQSNRQIAKALNKSTTTVGRVVNALARGDVIEKTRQRLLGLVDLALESFEYDLSEEIDGRMAERYLFRLGLFDLGKTAPKVATEKGQSEAGAITNGARDPVDEEKLRKFTEITYARGKAHQLKAVQSYLFDAEDVCPAAHGDIRRQS